MIITIIIVITIVNINIGRNSITSVSIIELIIIIIINIIINKESSMLSYAEINQTIDHLFSSLAYHQDYAK